MEFNYKTYIDSCSFCFLLCGSGLALNTASADIYLPEKMSGYLYDDSGNVTAITGYLQHETHTNLYSVDGVNISKTAQLYYICRGFGPGNVMREQDGNWSVNSGFSVNTGFSYYIYDEMSALGARLTLDLNRNTNHWTFELENYILDPTT